VFGILTTTNGFSVRIQDQFKSLDAQTLSHYAAERFVEAIESSQKALQQFASETANLTNIYDFTFSGNYLTNHEYLCHLQKPKVRRGIHVGNRPFNR